MHQLKFRKISVNCNVCVFLSKQFRFANQSSMRAYEHVVRRATNSFCFQIYLEDQGEKIAIILSALKCNWRFDYSYCYSRSPACSQSLSLVLFRSHMNDIPKLSSNWDDKEIVFIYKISFYCSPYISRERAKKKQCANVLVYMCMKSVSLRLFHSLPPCIYQMTRFKVMSR